MHLKRIVTKPAMAGLTAAVLAAHQIESSGKEGKEDVPQEQRTEERAVGRGAILYAQTSGIEVVATIRETAGAQDRASYELIQK
jgi:hypothetical protein